jgi:hypothetical protein
MSKRQGSCPNCLYIGDPKNCSCQWTIEQIAKGKGADPDVVKNAKAILLNRDR